MLRAASCRRGAAAYFTIRQFLTSVLASPRILLEVVQTAVGCGSANGSYIMNRSLISISMVLVMTCCGAPAFAQATRTWVSGVGDDREPLQPHRTV